MDKQAVEEKAPEAEKIDLPKRRPKRRSRTPSQGARQTVEPCIRSLTLLRLDAYRDNRYEGESHGPDESL